MNTLNLSGRIDPGSVAIYSAIRKVAWKLNIPYVVIGAAARDLVLHYGYGAKLRRATLDIDFGIQVSGWSAFYELRDQLIQIGFRETKIPHRLVYKSINVDIVPCGSIQDDNAKIAWPPDGDVIMNVLGFQEAINHGISAIIQDKPKIEIQVATPPGLSLLKLICWSDRGADLKNKDAKDFLFLLKTYQEIPEIRNSIYDHADIMEKYCDWDITLGCAYMLGLHAAKIASRPTGLYLSRIENSQIKKRPPEMLIEDMCRNIEAEYETNRRLLAAYFRGFNDNG